jgi:DNA primase
MSGKFDDTAKEEIRLRADMAAVVGRYVKLRQSGQTLKGLCPFHKEKTPSFHVNPARGFFHCFGCGKGGDIFRFVQEIEGVGFPEALTMLAAETGVTLNRSGGRPRPAEGPDATSLSKSAMVEINTMAAAYFYQQIRSNPPAVDYFKSRGLEAATVRDFRLGYAPPGWTLLCAFAGGKGISADALVACGCAVRKEDGAVYDRFRDRIMFPLLDLSGRVIGFAGRAMDREASPKYLNSPETVLYRKKEFLYGLNFTRQYIKEEKYAIVVEGYMDFLTLYQSGIRNAVATSGTAMTPEHAHLIKRFASRVVLVFDGDEAGQAAARRGVFTLAPFDLDVSVLVLPPEEDPDSLVKKAGAGGFRALLAKAVGANEFIIEKAIAEHGGRTPRGQKAVVEALAPIVWSMSNDEAGRQFKRELADRLRVKEEFVYKLLRNITAGESKRPHALADEELYLLSLEGRFIHLLFSRPELIAEARQYIAPDTLTDGISGDIYSLMLEIFDEQGSLDGILDRKAGDGDLERLISRMLVKPALDQNVHKELEQKIVHLRRKYLRSRVRSNRILLKSEQDVSLRDGLLRRIYDDTRQLHELDEGA